MERQNVITLVLENGLILRDPSRDQPEPHSRTLVSSDVLVAVNTDQKMDTSSTMVVDCSNCLIMPGLVNCHVHSAMSLFRGLADDLPLETWLNKFIFPCEAKHVSPEMVHLGSTLAAAEMALSGTTTLADAYFFMEESARAAIDIGLRAVIAQGVLDIPSPDAGTRGGWKERVNQFFESIPSNPRISPALFCHSPYLCGIDTYVKAHEICKAHGVKLFSHVAETSAEIRFIHDKFGVTPIELLAPSDVLDDSFVAVHCVHLTQRDVDILHRNCVNIVHCPESNMKLASGAADIRGLLNNGLTIGLGTDGPASNNNLDLFEEMRSASLLAKLVSGHSDALCAREAIVMATIGGAKALGLDQTIGTLDPGKQADIIVIDLDKPHFDPLYNPISQLVYSSNGHDVRDVFVGGQQIVRNRKLCATNYDNIRLRFLELASAIASDTGQKVFSHKVDHDSENHLS
ncbi:MAG: amidohydrolase [Desulfomonilaceae bacterium]